MSSHNKQHDGGSCHDASSHDPFLNSSHDEIKTSSSSSEDDDSNRTILCNQYDRLASFYNRNMAQQSTITDINWLLSQDAIGVKEDERISRYLSLSSSLPMSTSPREVTATKPVDDVKLPPHDYTSVTSSPSSSSVLLLHDTTSEDHVKGKSEHAKIPTRLSNAASVVLHTNEHLEQETYLGNQYTVQCHDVITGDHTGNQHPGNRRLMVMISMYQTRYEDPTTTRADKSNILRHIVEMVRESGGHFLRKADDDSDDDNDTWYDIGNHRARRKVRMLFRFSTHRRLRESSSPKTESSHGRTDNVPPLRLLDTAIDNSKSPKVGYRHHPMIGEASIAEVGANSPPVAMTSPSLRSVEDHAIHVLHGDGDRSVHDDTQQMSLEYHTTGHTISHTNEELHRLRQRNHQLLLLNHQLERDMVLLETQLAVSSSMQHTATSTYPTPHHNMSYPLHQFPILPSQQQGPSNYDHHRNYSIDTTFYPTIGNDFLPSQWNDSEQALAPYHNTSTNIRQLSMNPSDHNSNGSDHDHFLDGMEDES